MIPNFKNSTKAEREQYIKDTYPCISDCDNCGICQVFKNKEIGIVFKDYINGERDYFEILQEYR